MKPSNTNKSDICRKRAIENIGEKYRNLDGNFAKVEMFPNMNQISPDGLSLLDDLEFFLTQPGFSKDVEAELFKIIQTFSMKYIRAQRGQTNRKAG